MTVDTGSSSAGLETWITDSSPVILLAKVGHLALLEHPGRQVIIPDTVVTEIRAGEVTDPARMALASGWGIRMPSPPIPSQVTTFGLDPGEASVLSLALTLPDSRVVLDDQRGRVAAGVLGLPLIGTVGLVLRARVRGQIAEAAPLIRDLRNAGLFISDATLRAALRTVGENWP